jgi:hypothetical protein
MSAALLGPFEPTLSCPAACAHFRDPLPPDIVVEATVPHEAAWGSHNELPRQRAGPRSFCVRR